MALSPDLVHQLVRERWRQDFARRAGYQTTVEAADRQEPAGEVLPPSPPETHAQESAPAAPASSRSAKRPVWMNRGSIEQYSEDESVRLLKWLESDGLLRTNDQLMDLMVEELGFERRGVRIVARVEAAIARHRRGYAREAGLLAIAASPGVPPTKGEEPDPLPMPPSRCTPVDWVVAPNPSRSGDIAHAIVGKRFAHRA